MKFELKFHNILYFSWSESYFWKHLFLFRGFLIMKTTFSVWVVFNNFLLVDATDRRLVAIKSAFFIALSLYPLSFFANTPFNHMIYQPVLHKLINCCKPVSFLLGGGLFEYKHCNGTVFKGRDWLGLLVELRVQC